MTRDDLVQFARRDWSALESSKAAYWAGRKRGMAPAEILELGEQLRQHVRRLRPDWPSEAERAEDRATHERVSGALRALISRAR